MWAVINVLKLKKNQDISKIADHNLRITESVNVKKDLTKHNSFFVGSNGMDPLAEMDQRLEKVGKYRKDANKVVNLVLSASPEFFEQASKEDIKKWEEVSFKWAKDTFGEENIIYAVVHNDEKTKHFHISLTPIKDGKLRSNLWFDGPAKLRKLHTDYAKVVKEFGIKRGDRFVKASADDITSYSKKVNASKRYEEGLERDLEVISKKINNPTIGQRLSPGAFFNEVAKPFMEKLIKNLAHYKTKDIANVAMKKENKKLKAKVQELEVKLDSLEMKFKDFGLESSTSWAMAPKLRAFVMSLAKPNEAPEPPTPSQGMQLPGSQAKEAVRSFKEVQEGLAKPKH